MPKPRAPKKNTVQESKPLEAQVPSVAAPETTAAAAVPAVETKSAEPRKIVKRPEIVKTDARATIVPINLDEEIRRLAYLYSERRGFVPGHETEDWLMAEREVRQRYHQQTA